MFAPPPPPRINLKSLLTDWVTVSVTALVTLLLASVMAAPVLAAAVLAAAVLAAPVLASPVLAAAVLAAAVLAAAVLAAAVTASVVAAWVTARVVAALVWCAANTRANIVNYYYCVSRCLHKYKGVHLHCRFAPSWFQYFTGAIQKK